MNPVRCFGIGLGALLALSPAVPAPVAAAGTVHVWRVGTWKGIPGQFTSIQAAVNHAQPGDWVLVAPGDYHEKGSNDPANPAGVLINVPGLWLRGMDRNGVIVDGTNPGSPTPCSPLPALQDLGPLDAQGSPAGRSGVVATASDIWIQNLTVCNFLTGSAGRSGNQIWWNGGDGSGKIGIHGWWGDYLTATSTYSNGVDKPRGEYGIYVDNTDGPGYVDHSYASNMGDAAYYVGACPNCNSAIYHGHAQYSALGYSGTNSGGNLKIEYTEFDHNKTGVTANSQNNDDQPSPQSGLCPAGSSPSIPGAAGCTVFAYNSVHDNNEASVPGAGAGSLAGGAPIGAGMVLAGTRYVTLYGNQVYNNGSWGILVADLPDQEHAPPGFPECTGGIWEPASGTCYYQAWGNYTWANTLWNNGLFGNPSNGDLGLATIFHDPGNCFAGNRDPLLPGGQPSSDPPNLQSPPYNPCGQPNAGDMAVLGAEALCATQLLFPCPTLPGATYPRPGQVVLSMPPPQETMPDPCAGVPRNPWCKG